MNLQRLNSSFGLVGFSATQLHRSTPPHRVRKIEVDRCLSLSLSLSLCVCVCVFVCVCVCVAVSACIFIITITKIYSWKTKPMKFTIWVGRETQQISSLMITWPFHPANSRINLVKGVMIWIMSAQTLIWHNSVISFVIHVVK